METATQLQSISLIQLVKKGIVSNISEVRENSSGYPFVTLIKTDRLRGNKSQNIYFGKETSQKVLDNFKVGDKILPFLKECNVVKTKNAEGETRFKISHSTSPYSSEAELMSEFGLDEIATDFPVEEFAKQFEGVETNINVPQP